MKREVEPMEEKICEARRSLAKVDDRLNGLLKEEAEREARHLMEKNSLGVNINDVLAKCRDWESYIESYKDAVRERMIDCLEFELKKRGIVYEAPRIIHLRGEEKKEHIACIYVDFLENPTEDIKQKYSLLVSLQEKLHLF